MKPKDLKYPFFSWEDRKPCIIDRVCFFPNFHDRNFFSVNFDLEEIFGNNNEVFIEICSGNGAWIIEKALTNKHINWIAIEKRFDRVRKIWSKLKNHSLDNLLIVCGEGLSFIKNYLSEKIIQKIFVNFPDPWPKKRHEKHRLVTKDFVKEISRILKKNGLFIFVSDEWNLILSVLNLFNEHGYKPIFSENNKNYLEEWPEYGSSWFENLWREKGKKIFYTGFENGI